MGQTWQEELREIQRRRQAAPPAHPPPQEPQQQDHGQRPSSCEAPIHPPTPHNPLTPPHPMGLLFRPVTVWGASASPHLGLFFLHSP